MRQAAHPPLSRRPHSPWIPLVTVTAMALISCRLTNKGNGDGETELKIDSAHAKFFTLKIDDAVVLTSPAPEGDATSTATYYKDKANEHIRYGWLGQLKGYNAGSDFNREAVQVLGTKPAAGGLVELRYGITMTLAWPKEETDPAPFFFVMPGSLEGAAERAVWDKFGEKCSKEHSASYDSYDWRPTYDSCGLKTLTTAEGGAATGIIDFDGVKLSRLKMTLTPRETSVGKKPEYDRIWDDKKLVATIVFAKDSAGSSSPSDVGTRDFNTAYRGMVTAFGTPTSVTPTPPADGPGPTIDDFTATWSLSEGRTLEVRMFLIDHLSSAAALERSIEAGSDPGEDTAERRFLNGFKQRSGSSEYIHYGGHSGVGVNIRALPVITTFTRGLYSIYFLDGCNSYDYLDKKINEGVGRVNPDAASTKFVDVVSNAYPASFGVAPSPVIMLRALVARQATYQEILTEVDQWQRAIVEGEEDNGTAFPY